MIRLLGAGGMGSVYLAENPRIEKQVAIKVLDAALAGQARAATRFETEGKLISRIAHPNVVEIFDFGSLDDGSLYYVMEVLGGDDLGKVLEQRGQLTPAEAWPYVEQICAGLSAAHDHGVVHRDLKPDNVFVLSQDPVQLKILDFGIAKLLETDDGDKLTATGMIVGTPATLAPEQAAGKHSEIGPWSDIYSLGVTIYWMLAGEPPFMEESPALVLAQHIKEPPPRLDEVPGVPAGVGDLVDRCLSKAPAERPETAAEVAAAMVEALVSGDGEAPGDDDDLWGEAPGNTAAHLTAGTAADDEARRRPSVEATPLPPERGKSARPVWALAAVALIMVAGGFITWHRTRPAPPPPPEVKAVTAPILAPDLSPSSVPVPGRAPSAEANDGGQPGARPQRPRKVRRPARRTAPPAGKPARTEPAGPDTGPAATAAPVEKKTPPPAPKKAPKTKIPIGEGVIDVEL